MKQELTRTSIEYYTLPGPVTYPDIYEALFTRLPTEIGSLCQIIQGIMIHPAEAHRYGIRVGPGRWHEVQSRSVSRMLMRILDLEDSALRNTRPPEQRLLSNSRDFAVMLCAMLRFQGVPARVRYGYARYFTPSFYTDHVVCEYWRADEQRWSLVDAMIDDTLRQAYKIAINLRDLPRRRFLLAGEVWQEYRAGILDPDRCGVAPQGPCGPEFIRTAVLRDIAALNKVELLCQDEWDITDHPMLVDRAAELTLAGDEAFAEMRAFYEQALRPRMPAELAGLAIKKRA